MKSNTAEPSNTRPTLVNVGRRKLVHFARRLTATVQYRAWTRILDALVNWHLEPMAKGLYAAASLIQAMGGDAALMAAGRELCHC
jgi:hypothetical protein